MAEIDMVAVGGVPAPGLGLGPHQDEPRFVGALFMLPAAGFLVLFLAYPLVLGIWMSFTDARIGRSGNFIGLENYAWLIDDDSFINATVFTIAYTAIASTFKFAIGLYLAILLNKKIPFRSLVRSMILIPFIVPTVLSAIAFWWIFDPQFSIVSWSLRKLGLISTNVDFLGVPLHAQASGHRRQHLARHSLHRDHPFGGTADRLDVALRSRDPRRRQSWQMFRSITYPLLTPIIAVVMTFSVLFTFTDFQLIWAMTRGGPVNATHLMATLSYQRGILGGRLGEGAAIATCHGAVPARGDHDLVVRPAAAQMAIWRER